MEPRRPNEQEEQSKKNALQVLESDRFLLLRTQAFIGAILIRQNLIPVVDSRCPTASTDGQNIFVNPAFYLGLTPGERRFLLAHEVWHTVYLHFLRRRQRDRFLFNIATDMEVNRLLQQEHFEIPSGALLPPGEWKSLNAEEMYDRLEKKKELEKTSLDVHLEPGGVSSGGQDDGSPPDARSEGEKSGRKPKRGKGVSAAREKKKEIVIDPDYQVDFGDHPEDKAREKVIEAAVHHERRNGSLPGNIARIVEQFRAGKLNWKELLAQFVTSCFGDSRRWLPPNRRYISRGLYLQSRRDFRLQAVLAVDTSASTGGDLPRFAGELVNLLNTFGQYELKVICCDFKIQSVETYTRDDPFDGSKICFNGGGGTSFRPVFEYLKKNPDDAQILIYFTDGYGDIPEKPPYPVMWVITPGGRNSISWGYEIQLDKAP